MTDGTDDTTDVVIPPEPKLVAPANPYAIDLSPNGEFWRTVLVMPSLGEARRAAKYLLENEARNGMLAARVRPQVTDAFTYRITVTVHEEGVN